RVLDDDLEAAESVEGAHHFLHLRRMNEHALDLLDGADLADEDDAQGGIAARARIGEKAKGIPRRVAHQRERARTELRGDDLADAAELGRLAGLGIEK